MITPLFELFQDADFVKVFIQTPYVKISDVEFYISGKYFKFYVKPYFLRLNLPGEVIEDGREGASYDVEKGLFTIKLPKVNPGEEFEGLDMLTKLLSPRKKPPTNEPLIEVVSNEHETVAASQTNEDSDSDFDWEIEQVLPEDDPELYLDDECKYGFANQKSGVFKRREEELHEITDKVDPTTLSISQRRHTRLLAEDNKFDPDHYLADYFDDDYIQHLIAYKPPWQKQHQGIEKHEVPVSSNNGSRSSAEMQDQESIQFTENEKDKMRRLPNKEYLLDDTIQTSLLLGLVDIIFAYAYNYRTTEGENTVESAWTINKLSSTLSCFETFTSLREVLIACCRRCLSYPLYRHWKLAQQVLSDTKAIFMLGRRQLLKCLLEIHDLFNEDDPRYILNDIYISDYCIFIQTVSKKKTKSLAKSLNEMEITKSDVGWELGRLEGDALRLKEEDENSSEECSSDSESSSSSESSEETEPCGEENAVESNTGRLSDNASTERRNIGGGTGNNEPNTGQTSGITDKASTGQRKDGGGNEPTVTRAFDISGANNSVAGLPSDVSGTSYESKADDDITSMVSELTMEGSPCAHAHECMQTDCGSGSDSERVEETLNKLLYGDSASAGQDKIVVINSETF